MYIGSTDSDIPSDEQSGDLASDAFEQYLPRPRRHNHTDNPWRVPLKRRRKSGSRWRSRPPLPQQEEQVVAAPAEQASPSSSRSLLTSLPPRIAGQFPTQDNADAMADAWRESKNDFYEQKMQMRGTVAVATLA